MEENYKKLYSEIFGDKKIILPLDYTDTVESVLKTMGLPAKRYEVFTRIHGIYPYNSTPEAFTTTAKSMGMSGNTIVYWNEKIIQILQKEPWSEILTFGVSSYKTIYGDGLWCIEKQIMNEQICRSVLAMIPTAALDLSMKIENALRRYGIKTVMDVMACQTKDEFMKIRGIGSKSAEEIIKKRSDYLKCRYGDYEVNI